MEQIVKHSDGTTTNLMRRAIASGVVRMEQNRIYMGDDTLDIEVTASQPMDFRVGDTITVHGVPYTLNKPHTPKREGDRRYRYDLTFEGVQYELINAHFLLFDNITDDVVEHPGLYTLDGLMLNSLTGTAGDILKMIVLNANRVHGNEKWAVGTIPANTDTLNFTLQDGTCLEALQALCEQWKLEWSIATNATTGQHTINLTTEPSTIPTPLTTFSYGRTGGLYTTERSPKGDVVTRLYAYGGTQNVPASYLTEANTNRICIKKGNIRKQHLSYIDNVELQQLYGIREKVETFEEIYPQRVGTVTNIITTGDKFWLKFKDNDMFNLNARDPQTGETIYLIPGATAKVTFQTGQLAGYTFEVKEWDDNARRFTLLKEIDEDGGLKLPSPDESIFRIKVGDKYILTDINLPRDYVNDAETLLSQTATTKLAQINSDMFQYTIDIDSRYIKAHATSWGRTAEQPFMPGDFIAIVDWELNTTTTLRLTEYTYDIIADKYTLTIELYQQRLKTTQTAHRIRVNNYNRNRLNDRISINTGYTAEQASEVAESGMTEIIAARGSYGSMNNRMTAISNTAAQASENVDVSLQMRSDDRHISVMPSMSNNVLSFAAGTVITDRISKELLNADKNTWLSENYDEIDFTDGNYAPDIVYKIYAVLNADQVAKFKAFPIDEKTDDVAVYIGDVSEEDGIGVRTFTPAIGQAYMDAGIMRDSSGNAVFDVENKAMAGSTKIVGLRNAANTDNVDLVTLLGATESTQGGLRKKVSDKLDSSAIEVTVTAGSGNIRLGAVNLPLRVTDDNGTKRLVIGNDGLAFDAQGNISVKSGNSYVGLFRALTPSNTKIQNGTITIDNTSVTPVATTDTDWSKMVSNMNTLVNLFNGRSIDICDPPTVPNPVCRQSGEITLQTIGNTAQSGGGGEGEGITN